MRVAMSGVPMSGPVIGRFRGMGFDWGGLVSDLSKQWTDIAGRILTPADYVANADGIQIRNIPSNTTGVPIGGGASGQLTQAQILAMQQQQVTGVSSQTMFGVGAAALLVIVMMQSSGRR